MVVGVRAIGAEQHLEGPAWLLLIESEAFPVPEDLVHASAAQFVESTDSVPRLDSSTLFTQIPDLLGCSRDSGAAAQPLIMLLGV